MSELLKAFDAYQDFEREAYFTLCYNAIASRMILEVPLKANKENLERVLSELELEKNEFEIVFKEWKTEDASNSDFSLDYPFEQLYKGIDKPCMLWIYLSNNYLQVEFYYNCKNEELEQWVIQMNHQLRTKFGLNRMPKFRVLTKSSDRFETEKVRTEQISVDIQENYNDDFQAVHEKIEEALDTKQSGLVLLHGHPGTGKTTYIKSLISKYHQLNFIFVQNEFIKHLLEPDFISFLLKQRNAILIIEDAEKVITSREHIQESSVVSTILQLTDGLFSDYLNIKVICTFNTNISKVDSALMRKGRMIAMYEFKALSVEKTNHLLNKTGLAAQNEQLTISEIYNFQNENFGKTVEKKKIGFL